MSDGVQGPDRTRAARTPGLASLVRLRQDTAKPLYLQLEEQLRALIEDGTLAGGTTLPAERSFAEAMGVSRTTVQRCYDTLRRQRFLSAHGRLGFVVEAGRTRLSPGMDRLKGFTEEMRELGRVPSSEIVERLVLHDRAIASLFGLPSTVPFLKLVRIRKGDGIPLSREVAWYNLGAAPALAEADLGGSVYALLGTCGVPLVRCQQTIEAAMANAVECAVFGFEEPLPCLLIKRRSYDREDRMIEYVEGLFRGDAYAYRLDLRA
ncbi:GntR family transcriptional regulator [Methylobacterium isbiliense]|jgi:GntR family transcriptional regulator|uniref:HTH-type transcriptional repressor NagR n=1 Tax=Methylobacterium isbiliense TaxID=315478 RepID=A0ABQ4SLF9_9HYPH|nr:GntR family transcriptional regulator [Methylobacterium isbiliense]MDN3625240.1 GntR family transcriptional regulator [Methylobacterium isbiliense]GJE04020.1 HTH-type transcriptional repressor NagR [Methylobacterium isbiliense]